ncbi:DUF4386 domain-containing protein [Demequina capsici]|uniref:DUF4386 domain-containing protein n=1 Tax=Demequina capsici TaxID=3075620 RepID=A0AA96FH49_9MICO|nr:DUF4386 domain-containing protein [Demequina sp. PMTSA13]WNM28376.1 DUF4386 domain-containing protein [Demequina sp. PMTSA13]
MSIRSDLAPATAARAAGLSYLAMFALAMVANFTVVERLVVPDDAALTLANIQSDESAFRLGLAGFVLIAALDLVIAWALHVLLRSTGEARSLLAAWLRLGYSAVLVGATAFMAIAVEVATGPVAAGVDDATRASLTSVAMVGFDAAWMIGLVVFGLHLIVVGRILVGASLSRALGVVLSAAGVMYVADTFAHLVLTDYASIADVMLVAVAVPSMVGEMWLAIWLLARAPRALAALPAREPELVPA